MAKSHKTDRPEMHIVSLTQDQKKLVEENHLLIYKYACQHKLFVDEWYDILALALCKAAQRYAPERGQFSTFAYTCFNSAVYNERRREASRKRNVQIYSLIFSKPNASDADRKLEIQIGIEDANLSRVDLQDLEARLLKRLSDREARTWKMRKSGLTLQEIAAHEGVTQQAITMRLRSIEKTAKKMMGG